jgi:hypothetical protein
MAAQWAENHDLHNLLNEMRNVAVRFPSPALFSFELTSFHLEQPNDPLKLRELLQRETKLELDRKRNGVVASEDLISPSKKMWALATLYSSLVRSFLFLLPLSL